MQTIIINNNIGDIKLVPIDEGLYTLVIDNRDTFIRLPECTSSHKVQQAIVNYYLGK